MSLEEITEKKLINFINEIYVTDYKGDKDKKETYFRLSKVRNELLVLKDLLERTGILNRYKEYPRFGSPRFGLPGSEETREGKGFFTYSDRINKTTYALAMEKVEEQLLDGNSSLAQRIKQGDYLVQIFFGYENL